jgi:O-antigen ligase
LRDPAEKALSPDSSRQGGWLQPGPVVASLAVLLVVASSVGLLATPYPLLALAPAGILLSLLTLEHWPTLGYYLIVAFIPFGSYRSPDGIGGYLRVHWILGIILVGLAFLHWVPRKGIREELRSQIWPWLALFLAVRSISALHSPYPGLAWKHVMLLVAAAAYIGVTMLFVTRKGLFKILPTVVVLSVTLSSFLSVIGYFFNLPFFAEKAVTGAFKRGTGAAPDPNNMSLMIVFALPFAFHYFFHARDLFKRGLAGLVILINVLGVITTYSRGGALMFGVMLVGLFIEYRHRLRPVYIGLLLCGLASLGVFAVAMAPASYWDRLHSLTRASDPALRQRTAYVVVAGEAFAERPLLGHGPGAFRRIYAQTEYAERFQSRDESKERFAHNTYLEVLVGSGIIGLLVFLRILYIALRDFWVAKRRIRITEGNTSAILMGTYRLSFLLVLLYLLIFSDPYHKYMLLGIGLSQVAVRKAQTADQEG